MDNNGIKLVGSPFDGNGSVPTTIVGAPNANVNSLGHAGAPHGFRSTW